MISTALPTQPQTKSAIPAPALLPTAKENLPNREGDRQAFSEVLLELTATEGATDSESSGKTKLAEPTRSAMTRPKTVNTEIAGHQSLPAKETSVKTPDILPDAAAVTDAGAPLIGVDENVALLSGMADRNTSNARPNVAMAFDSFHTSVLEMPVTERGKGRVFADDQTEIGTTAPDKITFSEQDLEADALPNQTSMAEKAERPHSHQLENHAEMPDASPLVPAEHQKVLEERITPQQIGAPVPDQRPTLQAVAEDPAGQHSVASQLLPQGQALQMNRSTHGISKPDMTTRAAQEPEGQQLVAQSMRYSLKPPVKAVDARWSQVVPTTPNNIPKRVMAENLPKVEQTPLPLNEKGTALRSPIAPVDTANPEVAPKSVPHAQSHHLLGAEKPGRAVDFRLDPMQNPIAAGQSKPEPILAKQFGDPLENAPRWHAQDLNVAQRITQPVPTVPNPSPIVAMPSAITQAVLEFDELAQTLETKSEADMRIADFAQTRIVSQHAMHQLPILPRHVAQQIANTASNAVDRPVELALNPPELGNVRLRLTARDHSITVHVLAERPETLDLLRRHIDQLGAEFAELGYSDIGFTFSHGEMRDEGQDQDAKDNTQPIKLEESSVVENLGHSMQMAPVTGLDIRL